MIEPKDKFAKILSDLEKEIKDPHDLEIAKNKLLEASLMFMDITNRAMEGSNQYEVLSSKIDSMQKSLKKIEDDIYIDEDEEDEDEYISGDQMHDNDINYNDDFEFEIQCPYCNYEFVLGQDADLKDEIECPKCHKQIELDWDDYCDGECDHCASICYDENLESYSDETESSSEEQANAIKEDEAQYKTEDPNDSKQATNEGSKSKRNIQAQNGANTQSKNFNKSGNANNQDQNSNQINENEDDM